MYVACIDRGYVGFLSDLVPRVMDFKISDNNYLLVTNSYKACKSKVFQGIEEIIDISGFQTQLIIFFN